MVDYGPWRCKELDMTEATWQAGTQYSSTFGKLSSGHRTGKGQSSFQSQRRAMPKNAQSTTQLHTFYVLAVQCSKSFKPGFKRTSKENFQTYKLDLEEAEEPESKLPTSYPALLTMLKPLTVWISKNWKILKEMGIPDHLNCLLRNLYAGQEATVRTGHATTDWLKIRKGICQGCILSP